MENAEWPRRCPRRRTAVTGLSVFISRLNSPGGLLKAVYPGVVRVSTTDGVERGEIRRDPIVHCAPVGGSRRMSVTVYGSAATG